MDVFDIIGPVMVGPSSSHTAGACKIGNIAALILGEAPKKADITLYGSFAKTGAGHGTDKALVAGIMGYKSDDVRIRDAFSHAKRAGLEVSFECKDKIGMHPNTAKVVLTGESGKKVSITGSSVGGGRVVIRAVNDFDTSFSGENHTTIVVHTDKPGVIAFVSKILADENVNIAKMSTQRSKRGGTAALIIEADQAPSGDSIDKMTQHSMVHEIFVVPKV